MEHPYGVWSLLPPVLAITLAVLSRQVFLSLFAGIWAGHLILQSFNPIAGTIASIEALVQVFQDAGNTRTLFFSTMVGSLIALMQRSGGVEGFVEGAQRVGLVRGPRTAGFLGLGVGVLTFIESSLSCLVTGAVARPLFDRLKLSREKLAYVCDTTSAPICILIPLNGWGAYVLAQFALLEVDQPVALLVSSIPLNFYAILSLLLLIYLLATGKDFGPMKKAQLRAKEEGKVHRDGAIPMVADDVLALPPDPSTPLRAINMILPVAVMILMVPFGLYYTGTSALPSDQPAGFWEILEAGSGTTAVLWAVLGAVAFASVLYRVQGIMKVRELVEVIMKGAAALLPVVVILMMAFAIGSLCRDEGLQTGRYVASVIGEDVSPAVAAPLIFLVSCAIAFFTGTSWGTFAIMLSIGLPVAANVGLEARLAVAAVLGGGVFGDHCSPISDTTIVSSMASASDHIDHVRTQLPYALIAGAAATALYAAAGAWL